AMPRLEAAGYRIVLHVHDEIVAEVPNDFGGADEFLQVLTTAPAWAKGLPIAAKVREGPRFCKITKPKPQTATTRGDDAYKNAPAPPAEPVMAQPAAKNATPEPEILQQNSQSALPPWVEAPSIGDVDMSEETLRLPPQQENSSPRTNLRNGNGYFHRDGS